VTVNEALASALALEPLLKRLGLHGDAARERHGSGVQS